MVIADEMISEHIALTLGALGGILAHDLLAVTAFGKFEQTVPGEVPICTFAGMRRGAKHILLPLGLELRNVILLNQRLSLGAILRARRKPGPEFAGHGCINVYLLDVVEEGRQPIKILL